MDLTVIDISIFNSDEVKNGDIVEIFGPNRSLEEFAKMNKTIPYEIMTSISQRVKRVYFQE